MRATLKAVETHPAEPPVMTLGQLIAERVCLAFNSSQDESPSPQIDALQKAIEALPQNGPRRRLREVFRLSAAEADLLDLCLAQAIAPLPGQPWATPQLAAQLFHHANATRLGPASPLVLWSLVEPMREGLAIDPAIASAMLGEAVMDQRIATIADATPMDLPALSCWRKHDASERIASQLEAGSRVRVIIETPVALLGRAMALAVARSLGTRLVQAAIPPELAFHERAELFMRVNRIALLAGYVPCWTQPPSPWPLQPRGAPLQFVIAEPGHCPPPAPGLSDILMSPPLLDVKGRVELLNWAVPQSANWPVGDTGKLVGHSAIGADDILHLRAAGVENVAEAVGVLNTATLRRIGAAGTVMDRPYDWDDIVLPPKVLDSLRSIPFEHHHRRQLLDNVAKGALRHYEGLAISALFCGASGTGKTMAAQVIARDIGAELIRVDMASTISKYIGETAKNLRRIFEHAAGANTIIMFDEADALFAKRTDIKDAHDRHANADTTYLLQLIESFDGAVLLATNKRENIDPAFMRRIRHVVDFPQPGPDERLRIWTLHLRNLSTDGGAACTAQVAAIAPGIELSPAQIRNAAITAAYAALARKSSSIGASDIMAGLERELGKDGRTLGVAQRKRLESHG